MPSYRKPIGPRFTVTSDARAATLVVIRGGGDIASAVAKRLFRVGHRVLILEARQQLATAKGLPLAPGPGHPLPVVAVANRIQAYLDDQLLFDHRDTRFRSARSLANGRLDHGIR